MNAKTALIKYLLEGKVLNVNNCARAIGLSNIAREIPRMVEDEFGVEVSRSHQVGKNAYGSPVWWTNYRLNKSDHNREGIKKMREYLAKHWVQPDIHPPSQYVQTKLL